MHITTQSNQNTLTDAELVALFQEGDSYALFILIFQRYKESLKKVLGNVLSNHDKYEQEEKLDEFFHDLTLLRSNGNNRLSTYKPEQSFEKYICTILRNWTLDKCKEEAKKNALFQRMPTYGESVLGDEEREREENSMIDVESEESYSELEQNFSMVLALEHLHELTPRDRYIVLTYLLCECYKSDSSALHLDKRLARQLGITEQTVRTQKSRGMDKLSTRAKKYREDGVTFD